MAAQREYILIDEFQRCLLQHIVDALRIIQLAQWEIQFNELGIRCRGGF